MKNFEINWNAISEHCLLVRDISKPYDICDYMKNHNIRKYVYSIGLLSHNARPMIIIKYGMSADNSRNCGERVYRQIAHCKSWGELRVKGSSGADWLIIEEEIEKQYNITVDKNHLYVKIWDLTNYPFSLTSSWDEVNKIESHFINEYTKIYGQKPIGNINDEHNARFRPAVEKKTVEMLFD